MFFYRLYIAVLSRWFDMCFGGNLEQRSQFGRLCFGLVQRQEDHCNGKAFGIVLRQVVRFVKAENRSLISLVETRIISI